MPLTIAMITKNSGRAAKCDKRVEILGIRPSRSLASPATHSGPKDLKPLRPPFPNTLSSESVSPRGLGSEAPDHPASGPRRGHVHGTCGGPSSPRNDL